MSFSNGDTMDNDNNFYRVYCCGYEAYCDSFIARIGENVNERRLFFCSLIGTQSNIQAIWANMFKGEDARFTEFSDENAMYPLKCSYYGQTGTSNNIRTLRNRKVGDIFNKICSHRYVIEVGDDMAAVVFGPDIATVKKRAFLMLNAASQTPMIESWIDWLWDEVMDPIELVSFGSPEFQHAYLVSLPDDEILWETIQPAIADKILTADFEDIHEQ